ncbi:MFS transporter [Saccharomonospora sp. NPDC046836]|uniref:MFS transporter n=1 Tax=Saccharomonospora sp. NPDC046836 TaxID=3156921 RepID=UPI0034027F40
MAFASFSGTLVEFYDFQIYAIAAALVFPHVLFPGLGTAAGTLASVATFGVAFLARPIGSIVFGHFGDRLGRKRMLVITLLMMGTATVLIGLMPGADQIGVAAPVIVTLLRVVQGFAAGGEWAGAALFAGEYAPPARRGFWTMFPQLGNHAAIVLVNLTFLSTALFMSTEAFLSWGWRLPFLGSAVLVGIGLFVRLTIAETPVFRKAGVTEARARLPFVEAFRAQTREILLVAGSVLTTYVFYYLWTVYLAGYAVNELGKTRIFVLTVGLTGGLVMAAATIVSATLSDRVGRRVLIAAANAFAVVWALVTFPLLATGTTGALVTVMLGMALIVGFQFGPLGAFVMEMFATRYRYTASGVAAGIPTIVGGTVVPLLSPVIVSHFGGIGLGIFVAALSGAATMCALSLPETRNSDLDVAGRRA